jgi:hypothetical protein
MRVLRAPGGIAPACAVAALCACKADPESLRWEIDFESSALGARAALVESRIVKGGCDSDEILYVSAFAPGEAGTPPPELDKGSYGLIARAQDASCLWYAQGCTDVALPRGGDPVVVMLSALGDETLDCDACQAVQCGGGGGTDAGMDARMPVPVTDADTPDDASEPADEDAGDVPVPLDAAPPLEPVVISLEPEQASWIEPPLLVLQDDLASGGAYISYPWDMALSTMENQALKRATPPADDEAGGLALLGFDVPRAGLYRLWGKVIAPTLDEDSFWLRIDEGEWLQWNDISHQDQTWHWDDVRPFEMRADRYVVQLEEGPHVLRVSYRELGTKLDRLVIASDLDWVPMD